MVPVRSSSVDFLPFAITGMISSSSYKSNPFETWITVVKPCFKYLVDIFVLINAAFPIFIS